MAELGIRTIKIIGGEPLLRRGIAALIAALKKMPGIEQVTMTTNGILLGEELERLVDAGLDAVNISLDTLDGETFRRLTRWDDCQNDCQNDHQNDCRNGRQGGLDKTIRAIEDAHAAGLPVKLNCVPLRGINDHEVIAIAALAKDKPVAVRFIELMPLGCAKAFEPLRGEETAALLEKRYGKLVPLGEKLGNGPAEYFTLEGFTGAIGFIDPISRGFCENCNRLRISSLGFLRPCLSSNLGLDLKALLRSGAADGELKAAVLDTVHRKPAHHCFSELYGKGDAADLPREMFRIGG
jgi:cyclic pyranopterin phosphate synthase